MPLLPSALYPLLQKIGCVFIQLTRDLVVKEFNCEAENIYGCTQKTAVGKNFIQLCKSMGVAPPLYDFQPILQGQSMEEAIQIFTVNYFIRRIKWTITPIFKDENSSNVASILLVGINENIFLDFDEAEKKIKNFEHIINNIPHAIFWKDQHSVFLGCNEAFAEIAMLKSAKEIVGKTDYDLPWSEKESAAYIADDQFVIQSGKEKSSIEESLTIGNEKSFLLTSKVPLRGENGNITGVLGIFTDITKLKRTEQELSIAVQKSEAASQAKSDFIANMSHDLRTPITGILGVAQDLLNTAQQIDVSLEDDAASNRKESLDLTKSFIHHVKADCATVINSIVPLLNLFNEILETTRLGKGISSQPLESFDIYKLTEHNIALFKSVAKNKKLDLILDIDKKIPKYLYGSRTYLDRTLINLTSNALKFTEKGFVKIAVRLLEDAPASYKKNDKIMIQISIVDTGIGIPEDKYEIIFEHFSRLNASHAGIYKGSGLGLYTVKVYVKAMGGNIQVKSEVGKGTSFIITLPLVVSDRADRVCDTSFSISADSLISKQKAPTSFSISSLNDHDSTTSHKVLIVEDNPIAARALVVAIRPFNCHVDIAENGVQAIEKAKKNIYDIIFMDVGLPDINGIEVTKAIRLFSEAQKAHVPIIAVTGHADTPEIRQQCLEAGMQDVLSKPATPLLLQAAFERFLLDNGDNVLDLNKSTIFSTKNTDLPLLDWEASERMSGSNREELYELLLLLIKDLKVSKEIFEKAYKQKDILALRAELHRAIGGIVYICAPRLENALKMFQKAIKAEPLDWKECDHLYEHMQKIINIFQKKYKKS